MLLEDTAVCSACFQFQSAPRLSRAPARKSCMVWPARDASFAHARNVALECSSMSGNEATAAPSIVWQSQHQALTAIYHVGSQVKVHAHAQ